jgi:hypothetical protein
MNHHLTRALAQTYIDDLHRAAPAAHQRPQLRRRRHATRPRDSLDDIAHADRCSGRRRGDLHLQSTPVAVRARATAMTGEWEPMTGDINRHLAHAMSSPIVTEPPRRLEPVAHDPFIDGPETNTPDSQSNARARVLPCGARLMACGSPAVSR